MPNNLERHPISKKTIVRWSQWVRLDASCARIKVSASSWRRKFRLDAMRFLCCGCKRRYELSIVEGRASFPSQFDRIALSARRWRKFVNVICKAHANGMRCHTAWPNRGIDRRLPRIETLMLRYMPNTPRPSLSKLIVYHALCVSVHVVSTFWHFRPWK